MTLKVYVVYCIDTYPSFCLEGLFKSKESAKKFIEEQKKLQIISKQNFDIQLEEVFE